MKRFPFIIIEGQDGTGKTTLADAFVAQGYGYLKFGPPEYEPVNYYMDRIAQMAQDGRPVVLDRAHPSSFVYGIVFRGMDDLSPFDRWVIDGTLMAHNSLILYARPEDPASNQQILDARPRRDQDAETFEVPEAQSAIRQLYDIYMQQMASLPMLWFDFTAEGMTESVLKEAQSMIDYFDDIEDPFEGVECFGNRYSPGMCFVGAQPTQYLYRALTAAGAGLSLDDRPTLNKICIVENLPEGFKVLDSWSATHFVALSTSAHQDLDRLGITHSTLPHPTVVESTRYKDVLLYGKCLIGIEQWVEFPVLAKKGFTIV